MSVSVNEFEVEAEAVEQAGVKLELGLALSGLCAVGLVLWVVCVLGLMVVHELVLWAEHVWVLGAGPAGWILVHNHYNSEAWRLAEGLLLSEPSHYWI